MRARDEIYSPLRQDEIRVLVLLPSIDPRAPLEVQLETITLVISERDGQQPVEVPYDALSYTWGDYTLRDTLYVSGVEFKITRNLMAALSHLRSTKESRRIWVDAICINMSDMTERMRQVRCLQSIFRFATKVLIWLGEDKAESSGALKFLEEVVKSDDIDDYIRGNTFSSKWKAVVSLLSRPYFSRIWIVQEIAVARRADVILGMDCLAWKTFETAIGTLDQWMLLNHTTLPQYDVVQAQGASRLVNLLRKCFKRNEFGLVGDASLPLETLVFELSDMQCADPRDQIYAVLGLARETQVDNDIFFPDYTLTLGELHEGFFRFCLERSQSLDTILHSWNPAKMFPVWINPRNYDASTMCLVPPLGKIPLHRRALAGSLNDRSLLSVSKDNLITLQGWVIDVIEMQAEDHLYNTSIVPKGWWNLADATRLFSFLDSASSPKHRSTDRTVVKHWINDYILSSQGNWNKIDEQLRNTEVGTRIRKFCHGRKLVVTDEGLLGLVPPSAKTGDLLCGFMNSSAPIVLRHDNSFLSEDETRYHIVGSCLVEGFREHGLERWIGTGRDREIVIIPYNKGSNLDEPADVPRSGYHDSDEFSDSRASKNIVNLSNPDLEIFKSVSLVSNPRVSASVTTLDIHMKGYRLDWTCECGYKGFDLYLEHQPGAIKALSRRLNEAGTTTSLEPWDPLSPESTFAKVLLDRWKYRLRNLSQELLRTAITERIMTRRIVARIRQSPAPLRPNTVPEKQDTVTNESSTVKEVLQKSNWKRATSPSGSKTQSARVLPTLRSYNRSAGPATGTPSSSSSQTTPQAPPLAHLRAGQGARSAIIQINQATNFILLCFKTQKYLTMRHDLNLSTITKDEEVFRAFHREYDSKFSWWTRMFGLYTVQNIHFVKFKLCPMNEVDRIIPGMPPVTEHHYEYDPRQTSTPPIGSGFLLHRFYNPSHCEQYSICLDQMAKRVNGPPTPGQPPDLDTGWGMQLERGIDIDRAVIVLLSIFVSSLLVGILWSILKRSVQDGFAIAGYIATSEALGVATVQLLLAFGAV